VLSEPISKSSVEDWVKNVEGELNFDAEPSWHQLVAVDDSVVKGGGRPLYVWVAVDAYNNEAANLVRGLPYKDRGEHPQIPLQTQEEVSRRPCDTH